MKYLVFSIAILGILPAVMLLFFDKRFIRYAMLGVFLPIIWFDSTALNFLSHQTYKGTSRGMEISLCYIVAFIIMITLTLIKGIRWPLPAWGFFLYLLYILMSLPSFSNAESKELAFCELWKMLMMFLVYLCIYYYLDFSKGDFDIIMYSLGIVIVACFFDVVKQHFIGISQARGFFPHQNSLSMYMVLANSLFFSRFFNRDESLKTWLFFFIFCCGAASTMRAYSRGAFISFPVSIMITLTISMLIQFRANKIQRLLVIVLLWAIGFMIFIPKIVLRFETAGHESGNTRVEFAMSAMNMIKDKPWIGVGLNNWGIKINPPYNYSTRREIRHYNEDFKDGIVETIYLLVMAECGIPCFIILLLWFLHYFLLSIKLAIKLRNSRYFFIPAATAGGLFGIYTQSALEWVLKQQINFALLVVIFGMLSYTNKHCKELIQKEADEKEEMERLEKERQGNQSIEESNDGTQLPAFKA